MKIVLFILGIMFLSSSFTLNSNLNDKKVLQQQESYKQGYVLIQGQFKQIDLYFVLGDDGYMLFSRWSLRESSNNTNLPSKGSGYNKRAIPLNQQNQYAIQYNFTHYVETSYGAAYFIAVQ